MSERTDYAEVLRTAAPQGTVVTVETFSDGRAVLYVPTLDGSGDHDHITARAAMTVGAKFDRESMTVASVEDGVALVRTLAEHLYGNPDALGVSVSDTGR